MITKRDQTFKKSLQQQILVVSIQRLTFCFGEESSWMTISSSVEKVVPSYIWMFQQCSIHEIQMTLNCQNMSWQTRTSICKMIFLKNLFGHPIFFAFLDYKRQNHVRLIVELSSFNRCTSDIQELTLPELVENCIFSTNPLAWSVWGEACATTTIAAKI